jgi:hypothetical protein
VVSVREEHMQHLDEGTIHAWLDGALDAEEAARVEAHVAECESCRTAVAEARGLVAGAARILTALDQAPGGVLPRSPAFDINAARSAARSARSRSLWGRLHLTPVRAAAAALIFVAAGSVLVARYAPNAKPLDNAAVDFAKITVDSATTKRAEAASASASAAHDTLSVAAPAPVAQTRERLRRAAPLAAPPLVENRHAMPTVVGGVASAAKASSAGVPSPAPPPPVARATFGTIGGRPGSVADSISRVTTRGMDSTRRSLDAARRADLSAVVATSASEKAPSRAASPNAQLAVASYVGCYDVRADSTLHMPKRLSLDTTHVVNGALRQKSFAAGAAGNAQLVVSSVDSVRHPIESGSWQLDSLGRVHLELGGATSPRVQLQPITGTMLSGTITVGDRTLPIVLQRAECSPR